MSQIHDALGLLLVGLAHLMHVFLVLGFLLLLLVVEALFEIGVFSLLGMLCFFVLRDSFGERNPCNRFN